MLSVFGILPDLIIISIPIILILIGITFIVLSIVYRKKRNLFTLFLISGLITIALSITMVLSVILVIALFYIIVLIGM